MFPNGGASPVKSCTKCGLLRHEDEFAWRVKGEKRHNTCKPCKRSYNKAHYEANKASYIERAKARNSRVGHRYTAYRLTRDQWDDLYMRYQGRCWICREEEATVVDHDHNCCDVEVTCGGCVRGALCAPCNKGLGMFRDNQLRLISAARYLSSR